jgi:4-hydroxy-tetrahydrodipicolinate synthase
MMKLEGTYTAIATPFSADAKSVDLEALDALLDHQIKGGVTGIVPCGTTGESPTLSHAEQRDVIARTIAKAKGKAQVIAGTGSYSTEDAIEKSRHAEEAGADAVMVVVPYYNKPTQEGLVRHFVAVAKSVRCPVVIYNIPGRTGVDLSVDAMAKILEAAPNVVATKEATGNVLRAEQLAVRFGDRLTVLSGDDALTLPMIAVGAKGVISVASNVLRRSRARRRSRSRGTSSSLARRTFACCRCSRRSSSRPTRARSRPRSRTAASAATCSACRWRR